MLQMLFKTFQRKIDTVVNKSNPLVHKGRLITQMQEPKNMTRIIKYLFRAFYENVCCIHFDG